MDSMEKKLYRKCYMHRKLYRKKLYDDKTKWIEDYVEGELF